MTNMSKSFNTKVSHHLVILMFEDMTMPDILCSTDFEGEVVAFVVGDFHSGDCYLTGGNSDYIQE